MFTSLFFLHFRVIVNGKDVSDAPHNQLIKEMEFVSHGYNIYIENKNRESKQLQDYSITVLSANNDNPNQVLVNQTWDIGQVKQLLNETLLKEQNSNLHLVHNGTYLDDKNTIKQYNIDRNDPILAIASNKGGIVLQFMSWLKNFNNKFERKSMYETRFSINELYQSLSQTTNEKLLKHAIKRGKERIQTIKSSKNDLGSQFKTVKSVENKSNNNSKLLQNKTSVYKQKSASNADAKRVAMLASIPTPALVAIYLWTTNLVYKHVNQALESQINDDLNNWKIFLYLFDFGLRQLPYSLGMSLFLCYNHTL